MKTYEGLGRNEGIGALPRLLDGDITRTHLAGVGAEGIDATGGFPTVTATPYTVPITITITISLLICVIAKPRVSRGLCLG